MMDKKPHIKPYLYGMFAGFGAISLSILFFFLIYRFQGFGNAVSTLTGILMPFIYGSVIAYLLKPVCNWLEAFLHKLFPEKMHRFANMLAVALTILFGLLLIYALIMMIVPQLINSVTALYYTARDNIGDFVEWISKQELIANNKKLLDFIENSYDSLEANLDAWIKNTLLPSMQNILSGAAVGVVNVVTWIKNFVIGLIVSVYLLASRKKFGQQGKLILYSLVKPRWADLIMEEVRYADRMFGGFINGKILDSAIIGVLCYIACLIFKFPSALLVSVIIGVTNVIPFFGPFICAPAPCWKTPSCCARWFTRPVPTAPTSRVRKASIICATSARATQPIGSRPPTRSGPIPRSARAVTRTIRTGSPISSNCRYSP